MKIWKAALVSTLAVVLVLGTAIPVLASSDDTSPVDFGPRTGMLKGEVVGVMRVYSAEIRSFDDDDKYFAGAVANLGAIALENAKRFDSLQEEYESFRRLTM